MSEQNERHPGTHPRNPGNPWKWTTLGILALAAALVAGAVTATYISDRQSTPNVAADSSKAAPARQKAPERHASARPSAADIEDCNRYASSTRDKTTDTLKDALIGGAIGAGVGAAGGAIAGGGSGAGKGAGIGAVVGATAGTLYGLNQANQHDARAAQAYRDCMARRGYS
jgi:hypothetical protein